jgi:methionine synthase I (cobalamin-dependent)
MHRLIQQLFAEGTVLTDGAWGTQLQAAGLQVGEFPDAWNLTHPEKVLEVASSYVDAGSRVILTNTFGANRIRLALDGLEVRADEINRQGVQISKAAAGSRAVVFASVGPTGKMLVSGEISADTVKRAFAEQTSALADAGAQAILLETFSDLEEARVALAAAKETGLPVAVSMLFDSGKNRDRTMMGNTPEEVACVLTDEGADIIGANCGQGIASFDAVCRRLHAATYLPLWIKANAGLPDVVQGITRYAATPEDFALHVPGLLRHGARFVGGCCGTNPQFIRAIRDVLRKELPL